MEQFLAYHRGMFIILAGVCAAVAVLLAVFLPGDYGRLLGFVVGAAAQLAKFGVLDVSTIKRIAADPGNAAKIQLTSTFLSLVLFALAVVVVYFCKLDIWTMAAGIFLPRLILLADTFIRPDPFQNNNNE